MYLVELVGMEMAMPSLIDKLLALKHCLSHSKHHLGGVNTQKEANDKKEAANMKQYC
jgi:hypothetical protein